MKIIVERTLALNKYSYAIEGNDAWIGKANYTFGITLWKLCVYSKEDFTFELKQTNWFLKLLNILPVLNLETFTPFKYFESLQYNGYSRKKFLKAAFLFHMGNEIYELRQHNDNICSLMKNEIQVAVYKKEPFSFSEKNRYTVKYSNDMVDNLQLILLFCIFIDVVFYSNKRRVSLVKYERDVIINKDKYSERSLWRAKE